ncbi:MAG: laccase domain-containing protein, partial [Panacagrimonas sp.]
MVVAEVAVAGVAVAADVVAADSSPSGSMRGCLIEPSWTRHPRVRACMTTRGGGVSRGAYHSLNLATHVGDEPSAVEENRRRLRLHLGFANEPRWLEQVHGIDVVRLEHADPEATPRADASWTNRSGLACA